MGRQKLPNDQRGEEDNGFVTNRYVYFEGEGVFIRNFRNGRYTVKKVKHHSYYI